MIHNHEVPGSIPGLATKQTRLANLWLVSLFFLSAMPQRVRRSGLIPTNGSCRRGKKHRHWREKPRATKFIGTGNAYISERATKFITTGNKILSNGQRNFLNNGQRDFTLNNGNRNLHKPPSFIATGLAYLYYLFMRRKPDSCDKTCRQGAV